MTTTDRELLITRILEGQRRMQHLFAADRSDPLFESHLTLPQLKILLLLSLHGGASGQDLARRVHVTLATMTGIIDRLSAHGLVARHEDPRDRRVKVVDLTPAGHAAIDKIITAGVDSQHRILARLSTPDLLTVHQAVAVMIEAATADAADALTPASTKAAAARPRATPPSDTAVPGPTSNLAASNRDTEEADRRGGGQAARQKGGPSRRLDLAAGRSSLLNTDE